MKKTLRNNMTYANVISTLCLFLLLGGGAAFAAGQLAKNSVGTKQLKNGSVTTQKIKAGAVTGAKVDLESLGTVPSATTAATATSAVTATSATKANSASTAKSADFAKSADNADSLDGLTASQLVQGGGLSLAGRTTLHLGGGAEQHVLTVPGFGEVVGGCGSGGGGIGFVNHSGHDLRVYPFAGVDMTPVTISDGANSGPFPPGVGGAGTTMLQMGSTDFTDQRLLTVIATRDEEVSNNCPVQAWAMTR